MGKEFSERLNKLPSYLFAELDRKKEEVKKKGVEIIDLGVGDPDLPIPSPIVDELKKSVEDPSNHRYPSYEGMRRLRIAFSEWFRKRFRVYLDPDKEVIVLIGTKEGIAHLPLGLIDIGEIVLVPDPSYPVYYSASIFAGGNPYSMRLKEENHFLPDYTEISSPILNKTKLMFLNYPNNPTSAEGSLDFFKETLELAEKYDLFIAHDAAYSEISESPSDNKSFLEVEGAKDRVIEFHSLSKTFSMAGWRIGFAAGSEFLINALKKVKTHVDSGIFNAIQIAGIKALSIYERVIKERTRIYSERRKVFCSELDKGGFEYYRSKSTFYVWIKVPSGMNSMEFAERCLYNGVVLTPGRGFGEGGEGFVRVALTRGTNDLKEAALRIIKAVS